MFQFDLNKYHPKKKNTVNGISKYFCRIRKIHINITPEEKVRQAFLNYLIDEIKIPENNIEVEKHLFHYNKKLNGRIDILINDNNGLALAIYECKKQDEQLTEEVINQGLFYKNVLTDTIYLGYVIGNEISLFCEELKTRKLIILSKQPNLKEMLENEVEYFVENDLNEYKRYNFKNPIDKNEITELIECGNLGEHTDKKIYPFIFNFLGWILDDIDTINLENVIDVGTKYTKYGNASGGNFYNDFRGFIIENKKSKPTIWLTITSMMTSKNNIGTSILVAIEENGKRHSSLQLRLDNFLIIKDKFFEIWHDGKITVGKLGSVKKQLLIDFIKSKQPKLIIDNKVFLGKFDSEIKIKSKNRETKEFVSNLIEYALYRDQFREIWKAKVTTRNS